MVNKKTIEYFYKKDKISFKAFTVARDLGVLNLLQLKIFVDENSNFLKIKRCGNKENYELLKLYEDHFSIVKKKSKNDRSIIKLNPKKKSNTNKKTVVSNKTYLKKIMTLPNAIKDSIEIEPLSKTLTGPITIEYLYSVGSISKSIFETCNKNKIVTLNGLHEYIELNENFFGIKGCTKEESNDLINLHSDFYSNFLNNKKIEIKTTDSNRIREIKNIIINGLSDKKNENDKNESNNINNNLIEHEYKFDGYSFIINVVELEMAPLYWIKREGLTQYLFFNKAHQKSSLLPENGFMKLLIALTRTSLSFSDDSGDIFLNRLKNYLDLI